MCVDTAEGIECDKHEFCHKSECLALKEPWTLDDYKLALEHWKDHVGHAPMAG